MPHLPLLSPDADLLAALLRRNQFLEEQNVWLSFSCSRAPETAVPRMDTHHNYTLGAELHSEQNYTLGSRTTL